MKLMRNYLLCCFALALTACGGGGGSESGAGGGTTPAVSTAPYMGTYEGPFSLRATSPGLTPVSVDGRTTIVVNTDNSVVVDPGPNQFFGTYNPETQVMNASFPGSDLDPSCTGRVNMNGRHIFDSSAGTHSIDGTVGSANLACFGISMAVTGSFETNQINTTTLSRTVRGIVSQIRTIIQ